MKSNFNILSGIKFPNILFGILYNQVIIYIKAKEYIEKEKSHK
jgi:hypothetical protein